MRVRYTLGTRWDLTRSITPNAVTWLIDLRVDWFSQGNLHRVLALMGLAEK